MLTLFKYLTRGPRLKQRLPLLPIASSSAECRTGIDESRRDELDLMVRSGVAKTEADAMRLLNRFCDLKINSVIEVTRRERRYKSRLALAWHRFLRLF